MESQMRKKDEIELSLLKRFGLRYSVLAAWEENLREKGVAVRPGVEKMLARARVKISSGCFTACDVGTDLGRIEGILFSAATTAGEESAESWLDMLAECMSEKVLSRRLKRRFCSRTWRYITTGSTSTVPAEWRRRGA